MTGRRQRELQFRIDLVLDAAVELFTETSYEETTVEAIARSAEISVATLYSLFDSKRDIYKATIARAHERFFAGIAAEVAQARGPLDQVRAIVRFHIEHFSREERVFRAFTRSDNVAGMILKNEVEREPSASKHEFFQSLVEICQRGLDDGVFRAGLSAEQMALALMSLPHVVISCWLEQGAGADVHAFLGPALLMADRIVGAV